MRRGREETIKRRLNDLKKRKRGREGGKRGKRGKKRRIKIERKRSKRNNQSIGEKKGRDVKNKRNNRKEVPF
jgi:hypothetical protein